MAKLRINRRYADGEALTQADLDEIKIATENFNNITKYGDEVLQSGTITTSKLIDATVDTAVLSDEAATTNKFTDASVTSAKFSNDSIAEPDIVSAAVTTSKLAEDSVTEPKFSQSSRLPTAKLQARACQFGAMASSIDLGPIGTSSVSDVVFASITTTKDIRRFYAQLQGYSTSGLQGVGIILTSTGSTAKVYLQIDFYLNGTKISECPFGLQGNYNTVDDRAWPERWIPLSSFKTVYGSNTVIPAGSTVEAKYSYQVVGQAYINISRANLVLVEL